jgi:hypothetical protein
MIDLLKQYVDSGIILPDHQFNKLPKNLKITHIRRCVINKTGFGQSAINYIIENINNSTFNDGLIKKFLEYSPSMIEFIKNPSEDIQFAMVMYDPISIGYISNPSERVQLAAIKEDVGVIIHINKPTEKVQLAAVRRDIGIFEFINNPYPSVIKLYNELTK